MAKIVLLISPARSKFLTLAANPISFFKFLKIRPFLPEKNSFRLRTVRAYSCFDISPVQTPGQSPICRLKHGLYVLMFSRTSERIFCLSDRGEHLLSRYGKIRRMIFK